MIPRYFVVAESMHELQNPTSEEKPLLLGRRLGWSRLTRSRRGVGRRPALVLARAFGCTWRGVEISPDFHAVAVERVAEAGLLRTACPSSARMRPLCASSRSRSTPRSASARASSMEVSPTRSKDPESAVRPGGFVVVGEPYWRRWPLPDDYEERADPWTTPRRDGRDLRDLGVAVVSVIASSEDDWDRYETLHRQAVERWLAANPDDPDASEIRARHERAARVRPPRPRAPRLGDLRRLEAAPGREQPPEHEKDPSVPQGTALARVETHDRAELVVVGAYGHLVRRAVLEAPIENSSRPVSPSDSRLSPVR